MQRFDMKRNLRTGNTALLLEFDINGSSVTDTIFAKDTVAIVSDGVLTIRSTLKPSGSNQLDDIEHFLDTEHYRLDSITYDDELIIKLLSKFAAVNKDNFQSVVSKLIYKDTHQFTVKPVNPDPYTLHLHVHHD